MAECLRERIEPLEEKIEYLEEQLLRCQERIVMLENEIRFANQTGYRPLIPKPEPTGAALSERRSMWRPPHSFRK
jgi:hypothetical protein